MKLKALLRVGCMVAGALHSWFQRAWPLQVAMALPPLHHLSAQSLVMVSIWISSNDQTLPPGLFPSVKGGNNIKHWIAEALSTIDNDYYCKITMCSFVYLLGWWGNGDAACPTQTSLRVWRVYSPKYRLPWWKRTAGPVMSFPRPAGNWWQGKPQPQDLLQGAEPETDRPLSRCGNLTASPRVKNLRIMLAETFPETTLQLDPSATSTPCPPFHSSWSQGAP